MEKNGHYLLKISFENIRIPPFDDILILGKKCPHGKMAISQCLNLTHPDGFEVVDISDPNVEAILVSKTILKRMPVSKIIEQLKENVFPYITKGDLVKVNFKVNITYDNIKIEMD